MVAVGRDGEDLIALTLGQESTFALHHADPRRRSSGPMDSDE